MSASVAFNDEQLVINVGSDISSGGHLMGIVLSVRACALHLLRREETSWRRFPYQLVTLVQAARILYDIHLRV